MILPALFALALVSSPPDHIKDAIDKVLVGMTSAQIGNSGQYKFACHLIYLRPSKLLAEIRGEHPRWYLPITSELSGGAFPLPEMRADDEKATITLIGSHDAVDETVKILKEFDVPPRMAMIEVSIKSRLDKYETAFTANLLNNGTVRLGDGETGVELQISTRFNGDGSTSASIDLKDELVHSRFAIRINRGGTVRFGVGNPYVTWDGPASLLSSTPFGGGKFVTEQPKHAPPSADVVVSIRCGAPIFHMKPRVQLRRADSGFEPVTLDLCYEFSNCPTFPERYHPV